VEVEDKRLMRQFVIAGGVLIAITILAVGAYAAYRLVNADGGDSPAIVEVQPVSTSAVIQQSPTPEATAMDVQQPAITSTWTQEPTASATPVLPYAIRPYNPATDEGLVNLADITDYIDAISSPEHTIYEGSWEIHRPGQFNFGWCAIDANTLAQNLQAIEMNLDADGRRVEPSEIHEQDNVDPDLHCKYYRIVVEFLEPGEHRLLWTTTYSESIFDGWQTLEPGIFINEFVFDVRDVTSIEDDFNESSFHIQVHKENFVAWSIYHDLEVADILALTHAKRVSEVDGAYGLIFRYQDVSNFYYFMVDDTGYFVLGKRLGGEWVDLIDWTYSDVILTGEEFNNLGIMATGTELVAFINLNVVGEVIDDSFSSGSVGLIAQSVSDQGEMHAEFDTFSLEHYE
jgi:hypothetical protein